MGIEWAKISYLRGQQSVCVCVAYAYVCVCTLSGVSIYSRGDLDKSGQTHKHTHKAQGAARRQVVYLMTQLLVPQYFS